MKGLFVVRFLIASGLIASAMAGDLQLTTPRQGSTTPNNMPSLGWKATKAETIEVWIDGRRAASLPGDATRYVPFPLLFGEHNWKIIAVIGNDRDESAASKFIVDDASEGRLPQNALLLRHDWAVESSAVVGTNGAVLSSPGVDTSRWAKTSIPATVLTALVRNGVYPNPYVGLNNTLIPDANDEFNRKNDLLRFSHLPGLNPWKQAYWYRTKFKVPHHYEGKRVWLTFNEINYRADVWLNGRRVADSEQVVGMERTFRFEVTEKILNDGENFLAVAIHPLDDPGEPAPPPVTPLADPGRNMGADIHIAANYTKTDTVGWDWQPEVKDRDMGITEDVFLSATGDLEVTDLYVGSDLALPKLDTADLSLSLGVVNHSGVLQRGTLKATIKDSGSSTIRIEQEFSVGARETAKVELTPRTHPQLRVADPKLWWPAGLGAQHLCSVRVEARTESGLMAADEIPFGIRKLETEISPVTKTRMFKINGQPLFMQGGNWVMDMMLNWTASRYGQEIALTRQSRLNFLRIWGPTGVPPESFYDAADREGILLQQDFLNDWWGTDHNSPGSQPPREVVEKATTDIIKKGRNHPSIFLWCGGNEGPNPNEDLIRNQLLPKFDPWGSRYYLPSSNGDGLQGGGPYHNLAPEKYFNNHKLTGFNSEIGPSGVPEWESLIQFMTFPPTNWATGQFPLDGQWAYHDATDRPGENEYRKFSYLDELLRQRYGTPATTNLAAVRDYIARAQMLNYDTYRAVTESLNQHLWSQTTGFALWKSDSSWPSLVWQLYDWYQQCHAGFYAARRGCEPVHVQFNVSDRTLSVVNRTSSAADNLTLQAALLDLAMRTVWKRSETLSAEPQRALATTWSVPQETGTTFLKLRLTDAKGRVVSENLYWLNTTNDFASLANLTGAKMVVQSKLPRNPANPVRVTLTNKGTAPALLVRVQLVERDSRVEVLPTLWSDNYVSLLPGETVELTANAAPADYPKHPAIVVSGFNPMAVENN